MNILVTNDDGIDSVGLHEVARELAALGFVTICAPDREYSGSSVAIGSIHQLRPTVKRESVHGVGEAWSVDGPPALCVMLALSNMFERKFDLIVSGINPGANTGRNVYHSGTVGAVIVGRSYGVSGVAISQSSATTSRFGQTKTEDVADQLWSSAALVARSVVGSLAAEMPIEPVVINVNVPNRPLETIEGVRRTRIARESHRNGTRVSLEPNAEGERSFTATFSWGPSVHMPIETDVGAINAGLISISPVGYLCARDLHPPSEHDAIISERLVALLDFTS